MQSLWPPSLSTHPSVHPSTVWVPHFGYISFRKAREVMQYNKAHWRKGRGKESRKRTDSVLGLGGS